MPRNAFYGMLSSRRFLDVFERMVKAAAGDLVLPEYEALAG